MSTIQKPAPALRIDLGSAVPVVQQIAGGLRRCLVEGTLAPGDGLPSSRALARDLGVHFNTVAQAYRELESEGWLQLRRRAGTVVIERETPDLDAQQKRNLLGEFGREFDDLLARYRSRGLAEDELYRRIERILNTEGDSQ